MARTRAALLAAVLLTPLAGCVSDDLDIPLRAQRLFEGHHCGREDTDPALAWFGRPDSYRQVFQRLQPPQSAAAPPPAIRFTESAALLIEMGRQPTAGYRIVLLDPPLLLEGGTLSVRADWRAPADDALTAQVITSPCLLLEIPRMGYSYVQVVDDQGRPWIGANATDPADGPDWDRMRDRLRQHAPKPPQAPQMPQVPQPPKIPFPGR